MTPASGLAPYSAFEAAARCPACSTYSGGPRLPNLFLSLGWTSGTSPAALLPPNVPTPVRVPWPCCTGALLPASPNVSLCSFSPPGLAPAPWPPFYTGPPGDVFALFPSAVAPALAPAGPPPTQPGLPAAWCAFLSDPPAPIYPPCRCSHRRFLSSPPAFSPPAFGLGIPRPVPCLRPPRPSFIISPHERIPPRHYYTHRMGGRLWHHGPDLALGGRRGVVDRPPLPGLTPFWIPKSEPGRLTPHFGRLNPPSVLGL